MKTYFEELNKIVPNDFRIESKIHRENRDELLIGRGQAGRMDGYITKYLLAIAYHHYLTSQIDEKKLPHNVRKLIGKDRLLEKCVEIKD